MGRGSLVPIVLEVGVPPSRHWIRPPRASLLVATQFGTKVRDDLEQVIRDDHRLMERCIDVATPTAMRAVQLVSEMLDGALRMRPCLKGDGACHVVCASMR